MKASFIKVLDKIRLLKFLNLKLKISQNNSYFMIPILGGIGTNNLIPSEKWMLDILKVLIGVKGGSFLDIGANIGQTLIKLKSVVPEIGYFGFEPNPVCIHYLNDLIIANNFKNCKIFPIGLNEKTQISKLIFYQEDNADSSASMVPGFRKSREIKEEYISCFNIKDIAKEVSFSKVGIVKIDVEGAELEVLKGLLPMLESERPFIILELLPVYSSANNVRFNRQIEIENNLDEIGYKILRVTKKNDHSFSHLQIVEKIGVHSDIDLCDYLCCPVEDINSLEGLFNKVGTS